MYKLNTFVVISFQWKGLEVTKHSMNTPIVTENRTHVARFRSHSLRIHITAPEGDARETPVLSFLMLAVDLPQLCDFLQLLFFTRRPPCKIAVRLQPDSNLKWLLLHDPEALPGSRIRTQLQLRAPHGNSMSVACGDSLLRPFKTLVMGDQQVTIKDPTGHTLSGFQGLQNLMGPQVVWLAPIAWRMFEITCKMKVDADALMDLNLLQLAAQKYTAIICMLNTRIFHLPLASYDWESALPIGLLLRLMLDVAITAGFIGIYLDNSALAQAMILTLDTTWEFLYSLPDPHSVLHPIDPTELEVCHLVRWLSCIVELIYEDRPRAPGVFPLSLSMAAMADGGCGTVTYVQHVQHDLGLFGKGMSGRPNEVRLFRL